MRKASFKKQAQILFIVLATTLPVSQANAFPFGLAALPAIGVLKETIDLLKKGYNWVEGKLSKKKADTKKQQPDPKASAKKPVEISSELYDKIIEFILGDLERLRLQNAKLVEEKRFDRKSLEEQYRKRIDEEFRYYQEQLRAFESNPPRNATGLF